MRYLIVLVLVALALEGCAGKPFRGPARLMGYGEPMPMNWNKWEHETKTLDDFDRDAYECQRDNPTARAQLASERRDRCMLSKGWKRR